MRNYDSESAMLCNASYVRLLTETMLEKLAETIEEERKRVFKQLRGYSFVGYDIADPNEWGDDTESEEYPPSVSSQIMRDNGWVK